MILGLNLKSRLLAALLLVCYPFTTLADPQINNELLPPGEAMHVTDPSILRKLNLGPVTEPVWCYSNLANSLIISSANREREKCKLKLKQELELAKINCDFEIDQLKIQINSLNSKHNELVLIKDKQIEELTQAALTRPNDYSLWWATGGVAVGVVTTLAIVLAVNK